MSKYSAQIESIIADAERAAYKKGWDEAVARIVNVATSPIQPEQQKLPLISEGTNGTTPKPMTEIVREAILAVPGMRGMEIVSAVQDKATNKDRKALDRTVRTALARLSSREKIVSLEGKWYPNPTEDA